MYVIIQSESGDWFLVPYGQASHFVQDELDGTADYARYIESPEQVLIEKFRMN